MVRYQSIIVGGGPGGLACAEKLALAGQQVLLLEKKSLIGPKVCAGGVTWPGLGKHLPEHLIEKDFPAQRIFTPWQHVTIQAPTPIVSTVDREKLGQWMQQRALAAGVTIKTGMTVTAITCNFVDAGGHRFHYDTLVGADGSTSLVRQFLDIPVRCSGVGIHYLVPGNFETMEWHLDPDLFHNGYGWIFPFRNYASIGAFGWSQAISPKTLASGLHTWLKKQHISVSSLRPRAALVNFDYQGYRFGKVFLVGDAAGLASGLTGEGIYPAILSGTTVAGTIIDPHFDDRKLQQLIRKQQSHTAVLKLSRANRLVCRGLLETLVLALRCGIICFDRLAME